MLASIYLARAEAIKRHAPTVMCFSQNPSATTPTCSGTGQQGWIVFVDDADPATVATTDNNGVVDTGEVVLARHGALGDGLSVTSAPAGNAGYVSFNSAGYARENVLGTDLASLVLCDSRGNVATYGDTHSTARGMTLSNSGRPAITRVVAEITGMGGCP
jgi:Tfp pilus assembly protein FimT